MLMSLWVGEWNAPASVPEAVWERGGGGGGPERVDLLRRRRMRAAPVSMVERAEIRELVEESKWVVEVVVVVIVKVVEKFATSITEGLRAKVVTQFRDSRRVVLGPTITYHLEAQHYNCHCKTAAIPSTTLTPPPRSKQRRGTKGAEPETEESTI
jgi:hypothetical protein